MAQIDDNLYAALEYLGIVGDNSVRNHNIGKSNYSEQLIQPWTIWIAYKDVLTAFDLDIIKRVLRKKSESGMSEIDSRILDYTKIIHICEERLRQLEVEKSHPVKTLDEEISAFKVGWNVVSEDIAIQLIKQGWMGGKSPTIKDIRFDGSNSTWNILYEPEIMHLTEKSPDYGITY